MLVTQPLINGRVGNHVKQRRVTMDLPRRPVYSGSSGVRGGSLTKQIQLIDLFRNWTSCLLMTRGGDPCLSPDTVYLSYLWRLSK